MKLTWSVKPIKPRGRTVVYEDCDASTNHTTIADSYADHRFSKPLRGRRSFTFAVISPTHEARRYVAYKRVETARFYDDMDPPSLNQQAADEVRAMIRRKS